MKVYIIFSKVTYKDNFLHNIPNIIQIFLNETDANERCFCLGGSTYVEEHEVIE